MVGTTTLKRNWKPLNSSKWNWKHSLVSIYLLLKALDPESKTGMLLKVLMRLDLVETFILMMSFCCATSPVEISICSRLWMTWSIILSGGKLIFHYPCSLKVPWSCCIKELLIYTVEQKIWSPYFSLIWSKSRDFLLMVRLMMSIFANYRISFCFICKTIC